MSFCNTDILIRNITQLMKENGITQEKLAGILGMSQPNVSKALKNLEEEYGMPRLAASAMKARTRLSG